MTSAEASEVDDLLGLATRVLDGSVAVGTVPPARVACWLARRGLERLVTELLQAKQLQLGQSSMRSQLTTLSVVYAGDPALTTAVATLWDQLSLACHHHAYELTPTTGEAADAITRLQAVSASLG